MPRPQPALALALHAISAYIMYWGFSAIDGGQIGEWVHAQKGQHFQFLTIQGLGVAWLTMITSLLADILPSKTALASVKRGLLMVSMPLEVTISSIYWTLITLFPHLLIMGEPPTSGPSAAAAFMGLPLNVDLALHAAPAVALLLDFFFFERKYTKHQVTRVAPLAVVFFGLWYVSFAEYCASYNGRFPYPFLEYPYFIRALVYIGAMLMGIYSFRVINCLHS